MKFKKKVLMSQTYFWKEVRPTFSVFSCAKYRVTVARDLKINWGKKWSQYLSLKPNVSQDAPFLRDLTYQNTSVLTPTKEQ